MALEQVFLFELENAAWLVLLAALVDFFDGFAARMLGVSSAIGKDLDSLADCVTFGVVPGYIVFNMLGKLEAHHYYHYSAFLIPCFSAFRLAKFNHDKRQSFSFFGLPTPANGLFFMYLPLSLSYFNLDSTLGKQVWFWMVVSLLHCFLLVAPFRLLAFKFQSWNWVDNWPRYLFLIFAVLLTIFFSYFSIPIIVYSYIAVSLTTNYFTQPHEI